MYKSNSLGTVINRIKMACDTIDKLNVYTYEELVAAGYRPREPLSNTKDYIQKNKIAIINQAIERNITHELEGLKTANGKLNKLDKLYLEMKDNKSLSSENLSFLEELHRKTLGNLTSRQLSTVPSEVLDLIWFGDGIHKNYNPPAKEEQYALGVVITYTSLDYGEPSAILMNLPVNAPAPNTMVESPPYFPSYRELSPEQRWKYWQFLSNPFSSQNDVGYAFLFYYGLERHLFSGKLDQAFEMIIKLRSCYRNPSFQNYTAQALFLTCVIKERNDLASNLVSSPLFPVITC